MRQGACVMASFGFLAFSRFRMVVLLLVLAVERLHAHDGRRAGRRWRLSGHANTAPPGAAR